MQLLLLLWLLLLLAGDFSLLQVQNRKSFEYVRTYTVLYCWSFTDVLVMFSLLQLHVMISCSFANIFVLILLTSAWLISDGKLKMNFDIIFTVFIGGMSLGTSSHKVGPIRDQSGTGILTTYFRSSIDTKLWACKITSQEHSKFWLWVATALTMSRSTRSMSCLSITARITAATYPRPCPTRSLTEDWRHNSSMAPSSFVATMRSVWKCRWIACSIDHMGKGLFNHRCFSQLCDVESYFVYYAWYSGELGVSSDTTWRSILLPRGHHGRRKVADKPHS